MNRSKEIGAEVSIMALELDIKKPHPARGDGDLKRNREYR
jgi:hypothetical protein